MGVEAAVSVPALEAGVEAEAEAGRGEAWLSCLICSSLGCTQVFLELLRLTAVGRNLPRVQCAFPESLIFSRVALPK